MNQHLYGRLGAMREKFCRIRSLTEALGREPSQQRIDETLRERGRLIEAILSEREQLDREDPYWKGRGADDQRAAGLVADLRDLVEEIGRLDGELQRALQERMDQTREIMRGLYGASRAATAYNAHVRSASSRVA